MTNTNNGTATTQHERPDHWLHRCFRVSSLLGVLILGGCAGLQPLAITSTAGTPPRPTSGPAATANPGSNGQATQGVPTVPINPPTGQAVGETPVGVPTTPVEPSIEIVAPPTGNDAWVAIKQDETRFDAPRTYILPSNTMLWWYDSLTAQFVPLGWITAPVQGIGQFRVRWQNVDALIVPFTLNSSYGLTLDPSVVQRIRRAGHSEDTIEAFIYLAPDIVPQEQ